MSKTFEIGGYVQIVNKGNITCNCRWTTFNPKAYIEGKSVCRHIKELLKLLSLKS